MIALFIAAVCLGCSLALCLDARRSQRAAARAAQHAQDAFDGAARLVTVGRNKAAFDKFGVTR